MENVRNIHGTVMKMDLQGGVVNNYGTIMHLGGSGISITNNGTIMHSNAGDGGKRIVYRDRERVVYRDRVVNRQPNDDKVKQLTAELERARELNRRLQRQLDNIKAKNYDERLALAEERLSFALDANREAAKRIKELESGTIDGYLRSQIDPWDMKPTKEMCSKLLKRFECFIDYEE